MNVATDEVARMQILVRGSVQGVGFRPFVFRLARELNLTGWVCNSAEGVVIEAEGPHTRLFAFVSRLEGDRPPHALIHHIESRYADWKGYAGFEIRESAGGAKTAGVLPDIATCDDCLRDVFNPAGRRYLYPFTNCTHCGPRFTIIEALPYDRAKTTMRSFYMCGACQAEYDNPADRRFHAQPNACPQCGPQLSLWDETGKEVAAAQDALMEAARGVRMGQIVAMKDVGGFHLLVDARSEEAVRRLRMRKSRAQKPFATLYSSMESILTDCELSSLEQRLIMSPERPIVIVKRRKTAGLASVVAPENPNIGVMLPSWPLQHLLMRELEFPVVATSGNRSEEPICIDEQAALSRLNGIPDLFLVHNRPIARHADDSIVRVMAERELVLRRARGYVPAPLYVTNAGAPTVAVGGHLKNTVAVSSADQVVVSQHLGDMETLEAVTAFEQTVAVLQSFHGIRPAVIACDAHPDYRPSQFARSSGLPVVTVQHHYAHVLSCMAENDIDGPALGVAWDGTGAGPDGSVWGGEFLDVSDTSYVRFAHLRHFRLLGGEAAIHEPLRSSIAIQYEVFGAAAGADSPNFVTMIERGINSPKTSSAGRLFDAVSSMVGLCPVNPYEGHAAMLLEFATQDCETDESYSFEICRTSTPAVVDWEPMIREIMTDLGNSIPVGPIATKFHNTLAAIVVAVAELAGRERVVLSGGCFQNRYLTERVIACLRRDGFVPYWHRRIPPNDGGLALGQIIGAWRTRRQE